MVALFLNSQRAKFIDFYKNNIDSFEDSISDKLWIIRFIKDSKTAEEDDYEFALNESIKLLEGELKGDIVLNLEVGELYMLIGNEKMAKKYKNIAEELYESSSVVD